MTSIAAFIIVVCSIKMFRSAFTNPSHQFLVIVFTMLFFRYDFAELSESFLVDYFFVSILINKVSCSSFNVHYYDNSNSKFDIIYQLPSFISFISSLHRYVDGSSCGQQIPKWSALSHINCFSQSRLWDLS